MNPVNRIMAIAKHPATIAGVGTIVADQASKMAVRAYMPVHSAHWLVHNTIGLHHIPNEDLPLTGTLLLTLSLVLVGATAIFVKAKSNLSKIAAALVASGTISNVIDHTRFGEVTDFIVTKPWPFTYDPADIMITAGTLMLIYINREVIKDS